MDEIRARIEKLSTSPILDFLLMANEEASKPTTSLRPDIERAAEAVKRKIRNARMTANHDERVLDMQISLLKDNIAAAEKTKQELEKQVQEKQEKHERLEQAIKHLEDTSRDKECGDKRKSMLSRQSNIHEKLQDFAHEKRLQTDLQLICSLGGASMLSKDNDYWVFLSHRSDIHPISFSQRGSEADLKRRTEDAVKSMKEKALKEPIECLFDTDSTNDENAAPGSNPTNTFDTDTDGTLPTEECSSSETIKRPRYQLVDMTITDDSTTLDDSTMEADA